MLCGCPPQETVLTGSSSPGSPPLSPRDPLTRSTSTKTWPPSSTHRRPIEIFVALSLYSHVCFFLVFFSPFHCMVFSRFSFSFPSPSPSLSLFLSLSLTLPPFPSLALPSLWCGTCRQFIVRSNPGAIAVSCDSLVSLIVRSRVDDDLQRMVEDDGLHSMTVSLVDPAYAKVCVCVCVQVYVCMYVCV